MKKIFKSLLVIALFVSSAIAFVACSNKREIKNIYVDLGESTTISIKHESTFNPAEELVIKAILNDDSIITVNGEECDFSAINTNIVGEQSLTVTYNTYECTVPVYVYEYVKSIEVAGGLESVVAHNSNNGVYNTSNAQIRVNYSNDTYEIISTGFNISSGSTSTVGTKSVNITYEGVTITHNYTVQKVLTNLEVSGAYARNIKWSNSESYDYSTVTAVATYSNGDVTTIPYSQLTIVETSKINRSQKGEQKFKVAFGGAEAESETVNVFTEYESLVYVSGLTDIEYGTDLSTLNVKVKAVYTDGTELEITEGLTFNYDETIVAENVPVTISYTINGVTKTTQTQNIEVYEIAKELVVTPKTAISNYFVEGEEINIANFNCSVQYSKTLVQITDVQNVTITPSSFDLIGDKTATFSYVVEGKTLTKQVTVKIVETYSDIPNVTVTNITIANGFPTKIAHNSAVDLESVLKIDVKYSNGAELTLDYDPSTMLGAENFNTNTVGLSTLTITYEGQSATVHYEIQKTFVGLAVAEGTQILALYNADNIVDVSNVTLIVTYSNGTEEVDASAYSVSMSKANLASTHSYKETITFTHNIIGCYQNSTQTCEGVVTVYEEVTALAVINATKTFTYSAELEYYFDGTVIATFTSGNTSEITNYTTNADYINLDELGEQQVIVSCNGEETSFTITVKDIVIGYEIVGLNSSYLKSAQIDYSALKLKPIYAMGGEALSTDYVAEGFTFTPLEMDSGVHTFEVTYNGSTYTVEVEIVEYIVKMINAPYLYTQYAVNSQNKNTFTATGLNGVKGFTDLGNKYLVGDDNAFVFSPEVIVDYGDGNKVEKEGYKLNAKVYLYDGNDYVELTDNMSTYVSFNNTKHAFDFTDAAINKNFKIEVNVNYIGDYAGTSSYAFEFQVIDGYNAYTAADLALIDNSHIVYSGYEKMQKWDEIKQANGIDTEITTNAVILHSDIEVTKNDIPSSHFFKASELNSSDPDYARAIGSLKDSYSNDPETYLNNHYIYLRTVRNGETFRLEGNYFQIDLSQIPVATRQADNTDTNIVNSTGGAISTHATAFGFMSNLETEISTGVVNMNNLNLLGNAKESNDSTVSGGVIGVNTSRVTFNAYNNLTQACCIAYLFDESYESAANCTINLKAVNAYDSYNTLLYMVGVKEVNIDACTLIGAGGPVMICEHDECDEVLGKDDDGNDILGGYVTNVYVDQNLKEFGYTSTTILESWCIGTEGWFETYGASAYASMIKAMDGLINPTFARTILDETGEKINMIAVYKGGSSYGPTDVATIEGTFNIYGYNSESSEIEYKGGMDLKDPKVKEVKKVAPALVAQQIGSADVAAITEVLAQLCVLSSHNTTDHATAIPFGTKDKPWLITPDMATYQAFNTSNDYINIYLFNGMSAVLGLR